MSVYRVGKTGKELIDQMNETEVPDKGIALWQLGQESLVVKRNGTMIYFDPYLTSKAKLPRNFPPLLQPEDVVNADYVFISHAHSDHLDPLTLQGIAAGSPRAEFICPAPHVKRLLAAGIAAERIVPALVGTSLRLRGNIRVVPVACKHEQYFLDELGNHGNLGYVLDLDGLVFYHAGDALADKELVDALMPLRIEIACLPINGHDWLRTGKGILGNMTAREAADLGAVIDAELLIPMHYDLFAFNTENPAVFVDCMYRTYPGRKFKLLAPGERMLHLSERI
jgi:L-ascorbate metabolism protein UlaG (beta-lactamase superfamily)